MQRVSRQFRKGRRIALLSIAMAMATFGFTPFIPAGQAAAVSCHVFTPQTDFYEGGVIATKTYYVPGSNVSGCVDINVRNIKNQNVAGDYCATVKVQMFPTSGGSYYTQPKFVCSKDPDGAGPQNGPVVAVATNVLNGTKYRVLYNVENLGWTHTFQLVD